MKTPETDANLAHKICKRPDCTIELSVRNQVGLCQKHARWTGTSGERPSNGNGHAAAGSNGHRKAGNGSTEKANGHAAAPAGNNGEASVLPGLAPDRVNALLAALPAGDKERLARAWLRGEL
jgi:hypothetical protein